MTKCICVSVENASLQCTPCTAPYRCLLQVDGGDPMQLDGTLVLCVRSDDPSERHFDGKLAYLGLYDTPLNPQQIGRVPDRVERGAGDMGCKMG